MKTVYDILNDIHTDIEIYDTEIMSDIEIKKMKRRCKRSIRNTSRRVNKLVATITGVILVMGTVGGTLYAYEQGLLENVFKERNSDYEENVHYNKMLMESQYTGDIVIETNVDEELVDFEVLLAAKGKHSIICVIVVTYNRDLADEEFAVSSPQVAKFDSVYEKLVFDTGWGVSGWIENSIKLDENQELSCVSLVCDESEDISDLEIVNLEFIQRGKEIYYEYDNNKFPVASDGKAGCWYVSVPITQTYEDFYYDIENTTVLEDSVIIDKIYLDPSKLNIIINTERNYNDIFFENIELIFSNGDKLDVKEISTAVGGGGYDYYVDVCYHFDALIKANDVVAIEIEGQLIELK